MSKVSQTSTYMGLALGPNPDGVFVIGGTNDVTYGGDMSGDSEDLGITVKSENGDQHFALAVYADDGGDELTTGWVSAIFGSTVIYEAIDTASANVSAFGVTGQTHIDASVASIGNIGGVYGVVETSGAGVTITHNIMGGLFGATLASGDTLASGYYASAIQLGGSYSGTSTGRLVGIFFQNPGGTEDFDYAFAFGQDTAYAGVVTVAAVSGSQTHKLKVLAGGTAYYIPMYTA